MEFALDEDKPPKPVVGPLVAKAMVAPETAAALVADKLVKVTVQAVNACVAPLFVPKVQPELGVATKVAAQLVATLLYWSRTARVGCYTNVPPLPVGAAGCAVMAKVLAAPGAMYWVTWSSL